MSVERLETRTGEPVGSSCRHYDKTTGRMAQIGLTQQVKAMQKVKWPTARATDGSKGTRTVEGAAKELARGRNKDLGMMVAMYPTPTVQDAANNGGPSQANRNTPPLNSVGGGALNPSWVEWLMGWPIGWTDLQPSEMARFQAWWHSHGGR